MSLTSEHFIDDFQNMHMKGEELGRGGQGVVFRTRDPDVAIKLVTDWNGIPIEDPAQCQEYRKKLNCVRMLPLPPNIPLASPAVLIQNKAGYAMQLLNDMIPLKHFSPSGKNIMEIKDEEIPKWLEGIPKENAAKIVHYLKTGGLRRRLIGLYKCASILSRLHGAGLVYGDISQNNVYISSELSSNEVWFIDADNLRFETESRGTGVYTPGYGAPELVQGLDGGRPRTDCHAFAVMAFVLLTMQHPFIGGYVENGGGADWADDNAEEEDPEEKAYAGHIPWIDDEEDDSNATSSGLPRTLVLTEELKELFQETFGTGRTQFWRRPSIFHWPEALARAADQTVMCEICRMTYYFNPDNHEQQCPYCDTPLKNVLIINSYTCDGTSNDIWGICWTYIKELSSTNKYLLPKRILSPFSMVNSDVPALELELKSDVFIIKKLDEDLKCSVAITDIQKGEFKRIISSIKLPSKVADKGFFLLIDGQSPRLLNILFRKGKS